MQPHPVLLEPKRLEVNQIHFVAGKNVAGEPSATRHFELPQRFVERDRTQRTAVKRVVRRLESSALLEQNMMVVVVKNIPHHREIGRLFTVAPGRDRSGNARGRVVLVEPAEGVALDMRVHPVEVEAVVAAAEKLVAIQLQNRPGPLAAADI